MLTPLPKEIVREAFKLRFDLDLERLIVQRDTLEADGCDFESRQVQKEITELIESYKNYFAVVAER